MTTLAPDSRPARYLANLDDRLSREPVKTQRALLGLQLSTWTRAYQNFVKQIDIGQLDPSPAGPDISDYLEVIAEIQTRQGRLR
jgi:hypothetical protein